MHTCKPITVCSDVKSCNLTSAPYVNLSDTTSSLNTQIKATVSSVKPGVYK